MRSRLAITALGAAVGAAVMLLSGKLTGQDRALLLSGYLGLRSGVALGALVGGVSALWLSLGGPGRIAWLAAWMIALAAGTWIWNTGSGLVWIIEVVLTGIFGPIAAGLAPFVGIGILIALLRVLALALQTRLDPAIAGLIRSTTARPASKAEGASQ